MKRTRHQFAPAMPGQKVIDRAVAGPVPNGLLIGRLEIVDVQHLSGPGGLGEARQQGLLLSHRHVLALASAARLGLERLDPAVVIGHVRPVHRAQRDTHGRCNRRLRHPALAQQYHLDALTLHGGNFPAQRRLQLPDLGLAAFDHLFPLRIRWSERITPCSSKTIPFSRIRNQHKNRRFNQLWKRYQGCINFLPCEVAHSSLEISRSKVRDSEGGLWCQEADMAHDSLVFRFAVVLALAVIILVVMTLAAPPPPANGTAAPIPSSDPIYRAQYLNLY